MSRFVFLLLCWFTVLFCCHILMCILSYFVCFLALFCSWPHVSLFNRCLSIQACDFFPSISLLVPLIWPSVSWSCHHIVLMYLPDSSCYILFLCSWITPVLLCCLLSAIVARILDSFSSKLAFCFQPAWFSSVCIHFVLNVVDSDFVSI